MPLENKKAVVIAGFGTSHPEALSGLLNILQTARTAYPQIPVRLAFTSNTIRQIWASRAEQPQFWADNPQLQKDWLLNIKTPLATLADMQNDGFRSLVLQPTHIFNGEEYLELQSLVQALDAIRPIKEKWKPFYNLALGRPLLGRNGPHPPYMQDIQETAQLLKDDVQLARTENAALVYMGHGNKYFCTGAYWDLMQALQSAYPDITLCICCASGTPDVDFVLHRLQANNISRALLKPLMIVAGDHAKNDMAGADQDSLQSRLQAAGIQCRAILRGLGQEQPVADKLVRHIQDAAAENGIQLVNPEG